MIYAKRIHVFYKNISNIHEELMDQQKFKTRILKGFY